MPLSSLPMEHIERARPPWQTERRTECGRPILEFGIVLSREQYVAKVKEQGVQRAALTTCWNCSSTANRHVEWDQCPWGVLERQRHWHGSPYYGGHEAHPIDNELKALTALYYLHPDEFEVELKAINEAIPLADLRRRKAAESRR
jgi:hypothetical protein